MLAARLLGDRASCYVSQSNKQSVNTLDESLRCGSHQNSACQGPALRALLSVGQVRRILRKHFKTGYNYVLICTAQGVPFMPKDCECSCVPGAGCWAKRRPLTCVCHSPEMIRTADHLKHLFRSCEDTGRTGLIAPETEKDFSVGLRKASK